MTTLVVRIRDGETYRIQVPAGWTIEEHTAGRRGAQMLSTPIGAFLSSKVERAVLVDGPG